VKRSNSVYTSASLFNTVHVYINVIDTGVYLYLNNDILYAPEHVYETWLTDITSIWVNV